MWISVGICSCDPIQRGIFMSRKLCRLATKVCHCVAIWGGILTSQWIFVSHILCVIIFATKTTGDTSPIGSKILAARLNTCLFVGWWPTFAASAKSLSGLKRNWSDFWSQIMPRALASVPAFSCPILVGKSLNEKSSANRVCNSREFVVHFLSSIWASLNMMRASLIVFIPNLRFLAPPIQSST